MLLKIADQSEIRRTHFSSCDMSTGTRKLIYQNGTDYNWSKNSEPQLIIASHESEGFFLRLVKVLAVKGKTFPTLLADDQYLPAGVLQFKCII